MKYILLFLMIHGLVATAVGQQNLQFVYIGSDHTGRQSVFITLGNSQAEYLNGKYYTDQGTIDSIRSFILRSTKTNGFDTFNRGNGEIDSSKIPDAYKIIGVTSYPLYIKGQQCFKLFSLTLQYIGNIGLGMTGGSNAIENLMFQSDHELFHRNLIKGTDLQIQAPYPKLSPEIPPPIRPDSNDKL